MERHDLQDRFKFFALSVIKYAESLPDSPTYRVIKNQMIKSGTSAAANFRAAKRGRSTAEYAAKMGIVEEELDETMFWLEIIVGHEDFRRNEIAAIWKEANELLSITVTSIHSAKKHLKK